MFDGFTPNITVVGCQDGLDIGIVGDAQTLTEAWDLMNGIRDELAELAALVTPEGSSD